MTFELENPFAGYGTIVKGDRFTGRRKELEKIDARVFNEDESGSVAIVGEPKIGKSSLAYKATIERKAELLSKGVLPIWINLATYDSAADFFSSLVSLCSDELSAVGWLTDTIKLKAHEALQPGIPGFEAYRRIQEFFKRVRASGRKVVFILDEFDHARELFKKKVVEFQRVRDLAYNPEWRVHYITISRRSIESIEVISEAISTLTLTLDEQYLGMFSDEDLAEHFMRYENIGLHIPAQTRERILFYTGGHPYLLDMMGSKLVEICRERKSRELDIEEAARRVEFSFLTYFDKYLIKYIRERGKLPSLLSTLLTRSTIFSSKAATEFIQYGIVKSHPDGNLIGFSEYFQNYLKLVERESDLRSIWGQTEIAMRAFITAKLQEVYGEQWVSKMEKAHTHLKATVFDPCRERQAHEKKIFNKRSSDNLLDFTYPSDLFAIMFAEWNLFQQIFGGDKSYWAQRQTLLGKIRTVLGHYREVVLTEDQYRAGEAYCGEILRAIETSYQTR